MTDSKDCRSCGEPIKTAASICIHCQSFQDWRRYFSVGNTVITLVIAFLSVASITMPVIKNTLTANNSDLSIVYLSSEIGRVNLLVTNEGIRTGTITSLTMKFNGTQHSMSINGGTTLVDKGVAKKIIVDTADLAKIFYTEIELGSEHFGMATRNDVCSLNIGIRSFLGENKMIVLSKLCTEFLLK